MALEVLLTALVLGGVLYLVGRSWLPPRRGAHTLLLVLVVGASVGLVWVAHGRLDDDSPPPDRPPEVTVDAYVSSDECRSCHPSQYDSWWRSYHRSMTQVPTPETVLGDFDDVELELDGVHYHLSRRGDEYWVAFDAPARSGSGQPRRIERRIELATGSHHDQMYWYAHKPGQSTDLVLFAFDHSRRLGRWIPVRSSFIRPPGTRHDTTPGYWRNACSNCHATNPQRPPRSQITPRNPARMHVTEFGIACESCHGPGRAHIEKNRNPLRRYARYFGDERDPTIVQPEHLDTRRAAAVCGQCHGVWVDQKGAHAFKPGMDIHRLRSYVQVRYLDPGYVPKDKFDAARQETIRRRLSKQPSLFNDTFWADGMVRVSGREYNGLLESPCFEDGPLTCMSCHTLHKEADDPRPFSEWANDQVSVGMGGDEACTQCHSGFEDIASHTNHPPDSAGSRCYNCHMSYSVYGIQKAHRSHQIATPSVQESVKVGRPNACNQCHLDRTLAWSARHLEEWYGIQPPALTEEQRSVAAGVLWALRGDAGLRALMAWSMGWEAAREASGARDERDWMIPYLAQLLEDPYDSVRFIAMLSLRERDRLSEFDYDFVGSTQERADAARRARGTGPFTHTRGAGPAVLLDESGELERAFFARLLEQRDDRRMMLRE